MGIIAARALLDCDLGRRTDLRREVGGGIDRRPAAAVGPAATTAAAARGRDLEWQWGLRAGGCGGGKDGEGEAYPHIADGSMV